MCPHTHTHLPPRTSERQISDAPSATAGVTGLIGTYNWQIILRSIGGWGSSHDVDEPESACPPPAGSHPTPPRLLVCLPLPTPHTPPKPLRQHLSFWSCVLPPTTQSNPLPTTPPTPYPAQSSLEPQGLVEMEEQRNMLDNLCLLRAVSHFSEQDSGSWQVLKY